MNRRMIMLWAFVLICFTACGAGGLDVNRGLPETPMDPIVVSRIAGRDDKPYLEVDGRPFAMYGAQIRLDVFRNCEDMSWDGIERYFVAAKALNVNCVQVSFPWKFLEPAENEYRFEEIDRLLALSVKYDLKMELLWFSTNMIGDSYTWLVPQYILSVPEKKMKRDGDGGFHWLYGYTYALYLDDPWILERETRAVKVLFDHIRIWDSKNGDRHPVITCQVHNEPDAMVRWRMSLMNFRHRDGVAVSPGEIWRMTLNALDAVGQAVQSSSYRVATRTNIISGDGVKDFPQTPGISPKDVYALRGIDFVSFDPYKEKVDEIAYEVSEYASMQGNYPLVAENRGDYPNTASLMLAASALGGGYDIYDLATSSFIAASGTPPYSSEGIYDHELNDKPHTGEVRILIDGLTKASPAVALCRTEDFAVFNIMTDYPQQKLSQTIRTSGAVLDFYTEDSALAFVLDMGDYLVAYSVRDAVLTVSGGLVTKAVHGKFDPSGEFIQENGAEFSNNVVALKSGVLYRIGFVSDGSQESSTKKFIGTLFN